MNKAYAIIVLLFLSTMWVGCESRDIAYDPATDGDADSDVESDGNAPDGDPPDGDPDGDLSLDGDADGPDCTPGAYRCRGEGEIQRCAADGSVWEWYRDCSGNEHCENGDCVGPPVVVVDKTCTIAEGCENDDEYCLPDELGGIDGHCTGYCDLAGAALCPPGRSCQKGVCAPIENYCQTDTDCGPGDYCDTLRDQCRPDCMAEGNECPSSYDCDADPYSPNYRECIPAIGECSSCDSDAECGEGIVCEFIPPKTGGTCQLGCETSADCINGLACVEGHCVVGDGNGDCGGDCPAGYICNRQYNQCVLDCPDCGPNRCCDAASAPNCYLCSCSNPIVCGLLLKPCCGGFTCTACTYGVVGYCI